MIENTVRIDTEYISIVVDRSYKNKYNARVMKFTKVFVPLSSLIIMPIGIWSYLYYYRYFKATRIPFLIILIFLAAKTVHLFLNLIYKREITEKLQKKVITIFVKIAIKEKLNEVVTIQITPEKITTTSNKVPFVQEGNWDSFSYYSIRNNYYILDDEQDGKRRYYMLVDKRGFKSDEDKEKFAEMLESKLSPLT